LKRQKIGHNNNTTDAADAIATLFGANSAEKAEDAPEEQKHFNLFPELEAVSTNHITYSVLISHRRRMVRCSI
jgi:hypothetical protein